MASMRVSIRTLVVLLLVAMVPVRAVAGISACGPALRSLEGAT